MFGISALIAERRLINQCSTVKFRAYQNQRRNHRLEQSKKMYIQGIIRIQPLWRRIISVFYPVANNHFSFLIDPDSEEVFFCKSNLDMIAMIEIPPDRFRKIAIPGNVGNNSLAEKKMGDNE